MLVKRSFVDKHCFANDEIVVAAVRTYANRRWHVSTNLNCKTRQEFTWGQRELTLSGGVCPQTQVVLLVLLSWALVRWLKLPAWKIRDRVFEPHSGPQVSKMFLSRSFVKIKYCREPQWHRVIVLGLSPPELEFRILCLKGSVTSFNSPSSEGSPGPV